MSKILSHCSLSFISAVTIINCSEPLTHTYLYLGLAIACPFCHEVTVGFNNGQALVAPDNKNNLPREMLNAIFIQSGDSQAILAPLESPTVALHHGTRLPVAIF